MALVAEKTRLKINVATFLVLAVALLYFMAAQVLSILEPRYSVYAEFPDAGGVFTDQEVTYRGLTVGQVGNMQVVPKGVRIQLLIREQHKIPADGVEARVMFKSAVGEQFVDLLPQSGGAPYLEDGDVIPLERTSIPVSTQALLTTLQRVLEGVHPEALKGAIDSLGEGLTGRGPDIARIIESTADISETFARRAPEVEGILKKGTRVGGAFLDAKEDFARAIAALVVVSEALADSTEELDSLLRGSNLTADELLRLIEENRAVINRFLSEFAEVNKLQAEHAGDLSGTLTNLPTALEKVVRTFESKTGMVRFGLVDDNENPACSYGTPRRGPQDRSPELPPKKARCESRGAPGSKANGAPVLQLPSFGERDGDSEAPLPGLGIGTAEPSGPSLPPRMRDWSWSLFYLNGL